MWYNVNIYITLFFLFLNSFMFGVVSMPRIARKDSKSSFYHVMVQGINKEYIFDTDFNIKKYIELIVSKIYRSNIEILAYCIMNNHAHFLIYCEKIEELSKFMQN